MLPRIKEVRPMPDYCLRIVFDDGRKVLYDVKDDMEQIESYRDLATIHGPLPSDSMIVIDRKVALYES